MTFDAQAFEAAQPKPMQAEIRVPELAAFFGEAEPVWTVRGLEGRELAEANQAVNTNRALAEVLKRVAGGDAKDRAAAAMEALGVSEKVPDDLVRRHALLRLGSVDPVIVQRQAVRLARHWPVTFYALTNRILELTGEGPDLGESSASGQTPECETPSHSAPEVPPGEEASGSCSR